MLIHKKMKKIVQVENWQHVVKSEKYTFQTSFDRSANEVSKNVRELINLMSILC